MTRFDADTPTDRRKLFADAITAHRNRGSAFLTIEASPIEGELGGPDHDADGDDDDDDAERDAPPWVQFSEKTFNVDLTDAELDRLKGLVSEFPEFRIEQLQSPESAEGTNARVSARSDANRLADFADRVFCEVYGRDDDFHAWVVAI